MELIQDIWVNKILEYLHSTEVLPTMENFQHIARLSCINKQQYQFMRTYYQLYFHRIMTNHFSIHYILSEDPYVQLTNIARDKIKIREDDYVLLKSGKLLMKIAENFYSISNILHMCRFYCYGTSSIINYTVRDDEDIH